MTAISTDGPKPRASVAADAPALLGDDVRELASKELAFIVGGYGWGDFVRAVGTVASYRAVGTASGAIAGSLAGPVGTVAGASVGGNIGAALGVARVMREGLRH